MRKILIVIVGLVVVGYLAYALLFSGDGGGRDISRSPYKVLMLLSGGIDDDCWNRSGFEALSKVGKEMKIDVVFREYVNPGTGGDILREYSEEKSLFIIGWGGEFREMMEELALQYPAHKFAITGHYAGNGKNFGSLSYRVGAMYLAGAVAAMNTRSGRIGAILGEKLTHIEQGYLAFRQGAQAVNPDVEISASWIGSWEDSLKAIDAAYKMMVKDYDVILVNADRAGLPVHRMMERDGRFTIGVINDVAHLAPKAVLTSMMVNSEVLIRKGVELFVQGRWEGKIYRFGLIDGATYLTEFNSVVFFFNVYGIYEIYTDIVTQKILINGHSE